MTRRIPVGSCLLLLTLLQAGVSVGDLGLTQVPMTLVTAPIVKAKLSEAEANPDLPGEAKSKLIALYRKALANLDEVEANRARSDAFEDLTRTALEQTQRLQERTAAAKQADVPQALGIGPDVPLGRIEGQLKQEQAGRAAADARRADLERQLAYQQNRPVTIHQRRTAAKEEQGAIAAALQSESNFTGDQDTATEAAPSPALGQAKRWNLETRYIALHAEISALDQELISLPLHLDLLAAGRDAESADSARIQQRVTELQALVNARREAEARQVAAETERMLPAAAGDPALARDAEQNALLVAALTSIAQQGDRLDAEQQRAERLTARTQTNFERMRAAKAVGMPTEGLGQLLLEHRAALPDFDLYARRTRDLEREIAALNLSGLLHKEELERLAGRNGPAAGPDLGNVLSEQRRLLLGTLLEAEGKRLQRLRELRTTEARMLEAARAYDSFLREQLFWLPTGPKSRLADLAKLPGEVGFLFSVERWSELAPALGGEVAVPPGVWLSLLLAVVLVWKRRALLAAIQSTAVPLANPSTDRFRYTLAALLLTLAFAAPLPLVSGVSGWRLLDATQGSGPALALAGYLMRTLLVLYALLALRAICLPGGLALGHFRWAEPDVRRFDSELRWLTWILVPAFFVLYLAMGLNPVAAGGLVTRVSGVIAALAMGIFFYRLLHPKQGILRHQRQRLDANLLHRAYWVWFPILLAFPMLLVALAWSGYIYATHILADAFLITLGLIAALMLLNALAMRWLALVLARRRLALRAGCEQELSPATADLMPDAASDLDLEAASADGLELLRSATAFIATVGLYLIWSEVFPALGVLGEVTLWDSTATLNGAESRVAITLADLGLALVYLGTAAVLAKRLPALLNIILAHRLHVTSGSRYTITTLTTYAIIAIGTLLALNAIGAQWSQLQWLVAALGVGIGFGLQEIVANFISGLIILFERPIRVGDVVTVGNTDGVVTKIRIRATTIRNWDRKELLVPNKEFITTPLLNWSLSDQVTRVMVTVRVAFGTDVEQAHALMREAAEEHARVLKDPKPTLSFEGFSDNSLTLILRAFIDDLDYRIATITDLHKAIYHKFQQAGICIAYPQQDLRLDTREPLRVSLEAVPPDRAGGGDPHLAAEV